MGNPQVNFAAAFESPETPAAVDTKVAEVEQPRDFHFAVTWFTLFAHLDLIESSGPRQRLQPASIPPAPILDLVPVVSAPLVEPGRHDPGRDAPRESSRGSGAGWEMVVPKMIRTGPGQFTPADVPRTDAPGSDA